VVSALSLLAALASPFLAYDLEANACLNLLSCKQTLPPWALSPGVLTGNCRIDAIKAAYRCPLERRCKKTNCRAFPWTAPCATPKGTSRVRNQFMPKTVAAMDDDAQKGLEACV